MAKRKERPPVTVRGVRPDGKTPPELMAEEDRYAYALEMNIIAAKAIGGKPMEETKRSNIAAI